MELTYHWEGDYLIPDISLGDGSSYNIGKYGRMRQKYLCENYPSEYLHLVITEKLWKQLEDLEEECHEMLDRLMEQMAKREGLTEHMKSTDQLGWIRKMNSIQSTENDRTIVRPVGSESVELIFSITYEYRCRRFVVTEVHPSVTFLTRLVSSIQSHVEIALRTSHLE